MLNKAMSLIRLDFAPDHRQPSGGRVALATVVSIVGSLVYLAPVRARRRYQTHRAQPAARSRTLT